MWDASVLLGVYASQEDVWRRLVGRRKSPAPIVTLELGSGAGVASLLVAKSNNVRSNNCIMVMTDLPGTINFTKLNIHSNIEKISSNTMIVTKPLRWGRLEDIARLPAELSQPDIVFGADLLYTCDETVIRALADTVTWLAKRVAVFAVCKQHRPESIVLFLSLVKEQFDVKLVSASKVHEDLLASDEDFSIIELWRKRRRR